MTDPAQRVTVTDIDMPFGSMVVFMLKWALAAIPAGLILVLLGVILSVAFGGFLQGLRGASVSSGDTVTSYEADFHRWQEECGRVTGVDASLFASCQARKADLGRRDRALGR